MFAGTYSSWQSFTHSDISNHSASLDSPDKLMQTFTSKDSGMGGEPVQVTISKKENIDWAQQIAPSSEQNRGEGTDSGRHAEERKAAAAALGPRMATDAFTEAKLKELEHQQHRIKGQGLIARRMTNVEHKGIVDEEKRKVLDRMNVADERMNAHPHQSIVGNIPPVSDQDIIIACVIVSSWCSPSNTAFQGDGCAGGWEKLGKVPLLLHEARLNAQNSL